MNIETIYFALGVIRGAASVAQSNIRDVILEALETVQSELYKETRGRRINNRAVVDNLSKKNKQKKVRL